MAESDSGIIQEDEYVAMDDSSASGGHQQHRQAQTENESAGTVTTQTETDRPVAQSDTREDTHAEPAVQAHENSQENVQSTTDTAMNGEQDLTNEADSVDEIGTLPSIADPETDSVANHDDDHVDSFEDNSDISLAQQEISVTGENELLDQFSVTDTGLNGVTDASGVEQFMVSDTQAMEDEIPPMDGIDATPDQVPVPEPEDVGLSVDDAVLPDDVQDSTPTEHEVVAA